MRIRITNFLRWTAATRRTATRAGATFMRQIPGHLTVLIDLYSVGDLHEPRR
ncbi:hypothetical protein [Paraburkholderia sp.]|uniref:hypothetical protein n=1 Tax=Paraburkholderia sp. TaxID=1926495 RepID=UPI003D6E3218